MFRVYVSRIMPNKTVSEKDFKFNTESEAMTFFSLKATELRCKVISRKDYDWPDDESEVINIRSRGKNVSVDLFNESFRHLENYYK